MSLLLFLLLGAIVGWMSPAFFALKERREGATLRVWGARLLFTGAFSGLMLFVPSLQWVTMWVLVLGTFAALYALATRDRAATLSFAIAIGAALALMLESRSAGIVDILSAQTPDALRWYAFQTPSATLAFGGYLVGLSLVRGERLSATLYEAPMAVLGAVLFLGGWPVGAPVVGAAIVCAKALLLLFLGHSIGARATVGLWLSALGFALGVVGFAVGLDELFPQWSTLAIGFMGAVLIRALVPPLRRGEAPVPV